MAKYQRMSSQDFDDFIKEMEAIRLEPEEGEKIEDIYYWYDEKEGIAYFESPDRKKKANLPISYIELISANVNRICPVCLKGRLERTFDFESAEVIFLRCSECQRSYTTMEDRLCDLDCDTGPNH